VYNQFGQWIATNKSEVIKLDLQFPKVPWSFCRIKPRYKTSSAAGATVRTKIVLSQELDNGLIVIFNRWFARTELIKRTRAK
jgi:hypothetical protein